MLGRGRNPIACAVVPSEPEPLFVRVTALPQSQPKLDLLNPEPPLMIADLFLAGA